jgi:holo-[acyl-carrier protein] synthase
MTNSGIGTDIVATKRIKDLLNRLGQKFKQKIYTQSEMEYCDQRASSFLHYSGRFAAKEAIAKAMYQAGVDAVIPFNKIEIMNDPQGRPHVSIQGYENFTCDVSISHEKDYAIAFARVEQL